jgi:hypothetical protein
VARPAANQVDQENDQPDNEQHVDKRANVYNHAK